MLRVFIKIKELSFKKFCWFLNLAKTNQKTINLFNHYNPFSGTVILTSYQEILNIEKGFFFFQLIKDNTVKITDLSICITIKRALEHLAEQYLFNIDLEQTQILSIPQIDTQTAYNILEGENQKIYDINKNLLSKNQLKKILVQIDLAHPKSGQILIKLEKLISQITKLNGEKINLANKILLLYCAYPKYINLNNKIFIIIKNNLPEIETRHGLFFLHFIKRAFNILIQEYKYKNLHKANTILKDLIWIAKVFSTLNQTYTNQNKTFFKNYIELLKKINHFCQKYLKGFINLDDKIMCYEMLLDSLEEYTYFELNIMRDYFLKHFKSHLLFLINIKKIINVAFKN